MLWEQDLQRFALPSIKNPSRNGESQAAESICSLAGKAKAGRKRKRGRRRPGAGWMLASAESPCPSLTSLGQAPPEQSNVASPEHTGRERGLPEGFSSPRGKRIGAFRCDMGFSIADPSATRTGRVRCQAGPWFTATVPKPPPQLHPHVPTATAAAQARTEDALPGTHGSCRLVLPTRLRPRQDSGIKCKL